MREWQSLKETPRFSVGLQSSLNVGRQLGDLGHWTVAVVRRRRSESRGGKLARSLQFRPLFSVDLGPLAGGLSRLELTCIPVIIETLNDTVDRYYVNSL